jgi:hypothetical protein
MVSDVTLRRRLRRSVERHMKSSLSEEMKWGHDDCGLWFANIIKEALGYDPGDQWRGKYQDREGALKALGKPGLVFWGNAMAERYGWKRIPASKAAPGDVGFTKINGVACVVVCRSRGWFVGRDQNGFTAIPAKLVRAVSKVV